MKLITFLAEFIKHPKHIGAIAPSSKLLAKRMVDAIDFEDAGYIVELGPGTGVFTREIMKRKKKHTKFILIEINEVFARDLQQQFRDDPNVFVIHGSAEKIQTYMTGFVWTLCYFMLGYMFGGNINHIVELTTKYGFILGSVLVVIFGVHYIGRERKE